MFRNKLKVEMQCQNDFTSSYSVEQMRNNAEISMEKSPHFPRYLRSNWTTSLVSDNFPKTHPGPGT